MNQSVVLHVEGMSCSHCVRTIENALKDMHVEGTADLQGKSVTVQYDDEKITLEKIRAVIGGQGYRVV
ncbi:heavy-metal-associated domain-containing protein [bacterium]|nr:heavy-metal-associated domain-containing protein [bacterium]